MIRTCLTLCPIFVGLISCVVSAADQRNPKVTLTFIWHAGDRANLLQKIAQEYTMQTGMEIKAVLPPMTNAWYERIADQFARKGSAFDLCIFDSQNMSEFASQGHVVRLNDWLNQSHSIRATDFDPSALKRYAEYPENSGNIYALPINQDCMGLVYRRDLFDDPKEKSAFKTKYGYELAVPETYDQLRDIAEFFTRPDQKLFGIAAYGSEDYCSPKPHHLSGWASHLCPAKRALTENCVGSSWLAARASRSVSTPSTKRKRGNSSSGS